MSRDTVETDAPGSEADKPQEVPPKGWWQIVKRAWKEASKDQVPLLAAGVAFFGFLSLFPGIVAAILAYGFFADPASIRSRAEDLAELVPDTARELVLQQVGSLASAQSQSLGIGLIIALAAALWSASGGVGNLLTAVNVAYDEEETRGFVKRKAMALMMTVGVIVFIVLMLGLVAVAPAVLNAISDNGVVRLLLQVVRWVLLVLLVSAGLAILYRVAPAREAPKMRWVSVGSVVATILWVAASAGFSIYVSTFGNYAKTYGSLAGVAVLLLWLWISSYAVLLGAEINAESEQQTIRDTTTGPEQPLGERGAVAADSTPPS